MKPFLYKLENYVLWKQNSYMIVDFNEFNMCKIKNRKMLQESQIDWRVFSRVIFDYEVCWSGKVLLNEYKFL